MNRIWQKESVKCGEIQDIPELDNIFQYDRDNNKLSTAYDGVGSALEVGIATPLAVFCL